MDEYIDTIEVSVLEQAENADVDEIVKTIVVDATAVPSAEDISVLEQTEEVEAQETIQIVEIEPIKMYVVESDSAFAALGEPNESLNHALLNNRDLVDQHPITAITGLRAELDKIEELKTVYSDEVGVANYYAWNDGAYDEAGYFVSLVPDTSTITLCAGTDIFGVTVKSAGFVGNQEQTIPRDNSYALVAVSGLVDVRCESDVATGDYVTSSTYGMAEKTDTNCGYKVVAVENKGGTLYATIALGVQACTTSILGQKVQRLEADLDDAENGITAAMNLANEAYNKSAESSAISEEALREALEALGKADTAIDTTTQTNETLISVSATAELAKAIANDAVTAAVTAKDEAVAISNDALTNVNNLIEDLEPITTWEDPVTGNVGAEYFATYIKDGVATKVEVQTVESLTNDNKSAIEKSAEEFSSLISSVDKYSVGEYSQAYGLTREQAKSILKPGYVYIPTKHKESESHCEMFIGENEENWFTPGDYYVWGINDQGNADWIEHSVGSVWISKEIPTSSNGRWKYWYINSNEVPDGYESYALYIWEDDKWTKVNTLAGNVNNRITSMIRQDVNEISLDIANAGGSVSGINIRLSDTESKVNSYAYWPTEPNDNRFNLSTIDQSADSDGSSLALAVVDKNGENIINGATIVLNQDDKGSYIAISADNIAMDGTTTFITSGDLSGENTTTINGSNITTGVIQSKNYTDTNSTVYSTTGTLFDLETGDIHSKNFAIIDGKAYLYRSFIGKDGIGWNTDNNSLWYGKSFEEADVFLCTGTSNKFDIGDSGSITGWVLKAGDGFGVLGDGTLYCNKAHITGEITATSGKIGKSNSRWEIDNDGFVHTTDTGYDSQYWNTCMRPYEFCYQSFRDYISINRIVPKDTSEAEYLCGFKFEVSVGQENPTKLTLERNTTGTWGGTLRGEWTFSTDGTDDNSITMQQLIDAVRKYLESNEENINEQ